MGESSSALSAVLTYQNDNGTNYCANVTITNTLAVPATKWQVALNVQSNVVTGSWNGDFGGKNTGIITVLPSWNSTIQPGGTASFGFCANAVPGVRPSIAAWNMDSAAYATCQTNSGINPTKAALAVAMAKELGRWTPATDLVISGTPGYPNSRVILNPASVGACQNGCANTKAILGQQDASFVDQAIFNPTMFMTDLSASFQRQANLVSDLTRNNPNALPPAHKLTLVSGPTSLGSNNCGPHYIFQVDTPAGVPLTTAQAANMANAMCFYGAGNCGGNPYIAFQVTQSNGCPTGKTCIAVDPTDGDNGSTATTSAGSAPTYPMNRVWDPPNTLLNTACLTTRGALAKLQSKCSTAASTCGYLYCM